MKQMITRFVLLTIGIVLLVMIGLPETRPTTAAPLLVVTGTPQEPPTREPPTEAPPSTSVPPSQPTEKPSRHKVGDPAVTKSVNPAEARIGDEIVFTLDVTDRGEKDATDVVVRDEIPDYLDIIETSASRGAVSTEGRTVIVNIGTITPDEQITITIRTRVNERAQPPGGRNVATLTTSSLANDPSNDTSEVTFRIVVDLTPTPTATLPVSPTLALPTPGTATPVVPSTLPKTGAEESSAGFVLLIAALGLVGFALSLLLRRGARK